MSGVKLANTHKYCPANTKYIIAPILPKNNKLRRAIITIPPPPKPDMQHLHF